MYRIVPFFIILLLFSCSKDTFNTSADAAISISADTLKFDTVFTSVGSVTQRFKIRNDNDQKLNLSSIGLAGGTASGYQLNINGIAANSVSNIELAPQDSLYIFVKITINPSAANLPFIVQDSIRISYNGNTRWVQLQAYGQNARFLTNEKISTNATWNNQLPYVILGGLTVNAGASLTINQGTRIYSHANAPIIIQGTLRVNGEKDTAGRVRFQGDRLDPAYRELPAAWPGIVFSNTSKENVLTYAVIKNAYQALVVADGVANPSPQLTLNECIIDNAYDIGLYAINSSVQSRNCLFSNCGNDATTGNGGSNILLAGGNYIFNYATIVTYANAYQTHKQPVAYITNTYSGTPFQLSAVFRNSIIYGESGLVDDEIRTNLQTGTAFNVTLQNVLYKTKNTPAGITASNSINNQQPLFDTINTSRRIFDFRLRSGSPAENKGIPVAAVTRDLDGNLRSATNPDLGCYERP